MEDELASIEKNKPPPDPNKKKPVEGDGPSAAEAAAPSAAPAAAAPADAPAAAPAAEAKPPEVGKTLEQTDDGKEARLGTAGTLRLALTSASGLMAMDKNGLSDPYVVAKRGKKSKTSKMEKINDTK